MNAGICLSVFGSLKGMKRKMGGNLDRTTVAILLERFSKRFDNVYLFSHDSEDFSDWLPDNVFQVKLRNKFLYFFLGWIVTLFYARTKNIRLISVQGGAGLTPVFLANRLSGARILLQYDNTLYLTAKNRMKRAVFKTIERLMLNFVDYFMISSDEIRSFAGRRDGILPVKKGITLKGINPDKIEPHPIFGKIKGRAVAYIGRLSEEKDPITAIKAFALVGRKRKDAHLVICGDGPLMEECRKIAGKNVHFLGFVKDALSVLKGSDILILPSKYDASPKVIMEAMFMERPCIATRVGGVPDFIGDKWGILVNPGDPEELSEKILYLLENPGVGEKMGLEGHKRVLDVHDLGRNIDREIDIIMKDIRR
jgi:glycosyltransferase involved in cell wall biosynthesis